MPEHRAISSENVSSDPYWWDEASPLNKQDSIPARTDVLVIGGCYTGLSAALELARGGAEVSVLEMDRFGSGASSRNGGLISSGINVGKGTRTVAAHGQAQVTAMLTEANAAYMHLREVISREGIRCHITESGRFVPAHCPAAYEALAARVDMLNQLTGAQAWMLPQADQHRELASDYYFGGLVSERSGGLHPALFVRGLALAAAHAGARLHANCPAGYIDRTASGFLVATPKGSIKASEILLATNGYTNNNTSWHRRRLIPVRSHIIATEDLGVSQVGELFPNFRMVSDTKRNLFYFRPSPDGRRVLFGGRAGVGTMEPDAATPLLRQNLISIFPQLANVRLTHSWAGNVALTFDRLPHVGSHDGLRFALGCNGSGVVMMTWLGHQVALQILGRGDPPSAYAAIPMPSMPLYTGSPWMLPAAGAWYTARDWLDRWWANA
ncbi:MAG: NAD(P)/FAD-dependent oxidoreductase [Hyphomicrobiales bacterium]